MKYQYPDFYNDVFGPVMQPFSSAHTAGPCRMGYLAYTVLGEAVKKIRIQIDPDSTFVSTFGLQNEDLALLSGCTGHLPDDAILFSMKEVCKREEIAYEFLFEYLEESRHHTAAKITLTGVSGKTITMVSQSTGGGLVETTSVNGYPFVGNGDTYVVFVFDRMGEYRLKELEERLGHDMDILESGESVAEGRGVMYWFKSSEEPVLESLESSGMKVAVMRPVTAVITSRNKKPQMFETMEQWRAVAKEQGKGLAEAAIDYEIASSCWSREQVVDYMEHVIKAKMHRATHAIYEEDITLKTNPFSEFQHENWERHLSSGPRFTGPTIGKALRYAYAAMTGIPGVEFIPGPMGSGGGLIYSALCAVAEDFGYSDEDITRGLFVAAGIGAICFTRSVPGGGNAGCMGEIGMCGAMAAGAVAEMAGSTPEQVEAAAAMAMMISVGWPCDPISGGKGQPCGTRAAEAVCMALVYAEIARSGKDPVLPFHEVLDVATTVGRLLPSTCRGSDKGGHCLAPTAVSCIQCFREWHHSL